MKKQLLTAIVAGALLFSLSACGDSADSLAGQTLTGTVSAISADELSLDTEDAGAVTIPLSDDTVFERARGGMGGQMLGGAPADGENPPDMPDGAAEGETPPDAPDGATGGETPPDAPNGGEMPADLPDGAAPDSMAQEALTYEDVAVGDAVTVVVGEDGIADSVTLSSGPGGMGGPGGQSSAPDSYDAVTEYTEDTQVSGSQVDSTGTDENAVLVASEGVTATLDDMTITRDSGDSSGGDSASFYGVGAAALVTDGTLVISNSTITTDAAGGAGVFAYGNGTAYVSDTTITTAQDTSGGIHVAGGGTRIRRGHSFRPGQRHHGGGRRQLYLQRRGFPRRLQHCGYHRPQCRPGFHRFRSRVHRGAQYPAALRLRSLR